MAVLISGSGSNLQAILDARTSADECATEPVVVISDRPRAYGLDRADAAGIPTEVVLWSDYESREAFTSAICDVIEKYQARLVVLAGFMRILSPEAVTRFPHAILNVHPALLPAFPGAHAVEQALAYGVKQTGVTVHFVDEHVDHGAIIAQRSVGINNDDDLASLHARLQKAEHKLYPKCIEAAAQGRLRVEGRKVIWDGH
jgi:phosphoribosylglycinamide formyltransferase-1